MTTITDMKSLSEIFEDQVAADIETVKELLKREGNANDNNDISMHFPDGASLPNYHEQQWKHSYEVIINRELSNRRDIIAFFKRYLCTLWGESEADRQVYIFTVEIYY